MFLRKFAVAIGRTVLGGDVKNGVFQIIQN